MLPLERAQLFLAKSPMHVKKQYANDSDLHIGITWQKFKTQMATAWVDAFRKRRLLFDMGLDVVPEAPAVPDYPPPAYPATPLSSPSFNSEVDDVMIEIQCKEGGCGPFLYSQQKIQWLRDKFQANFKMPSRCVKHKAIVDADRNGSPPENAAPAVPEVPANNRFGSRRSQLRLLRLKTIMVRG